MKPTIAATFSLTYSVAALSATEPLRVLPSNWRYQITSLRGPGCPDFGEDPDVGRTTRLTFGQNTVDGSEIYYWFVAYPHIRVDLIEKDHTWCETELSYEEFKDVTQTVKSADYRLRLHKNGTKIIATYDLEKGVQAKFKATYEENDEKNTTDVITWNGPLASGQYHKEESSPAAEYEIYKLPKCGTGKIKFRTELSIEGKAGSNGFVASEHTKDAEGIEQYYGIQQGFSYDWEKCEK